MSYLFSAEHPWEILRDDNHTSIRSGLYTIADVYGTPDEFYPEETQEANADLMRAAPEMYRLLETLCILISTKKYDKLDELRHKIHNLFLTMGVTFTQRHLRNLKRLEEQEEVAKAKKEMEEADEI